MEGTGILLVEQNVHRALTIASRGYLLSLGNVVAAASSARILADPALHASYLGRSGDELGES
jgi:branched-chain amino acid transport system ATP-binding protein